MNEIPKRKLSEVKTLALLEAADLVLEDLIPQYDLAPGEITFVLLAAAYKLARQANAPEGFLQKELAIIEKMGRN